MTCVTTGVLWTVRCVHEWAGKSGLANAECALHRPVKGGAAAARPRLAFRNSSSARRCFGDLRPHRSAEPRVSDGFGATPCTMSPRAAPAERSASMARVGAGAGLRNRLRVALERLGGHRRAYLEGTVASESTGATLLGCEQSAASLGSYGGFGIAWGGTRLAAAARRPRRRCG
jgi:hypothetical protein